MATTKTKAPKRPKNVEVDVMTLTEAAAYLRVTEDVIVRLVNEQKLPGRFVGDGWRFSKSGLQSWLNTPMPIPSKEAVLAAISSREEDPYVDEMLKEIYKQRGRPMTEEEE